MQFGLKFTEVSDVAETDLLTHSLEAREEAVFSARAMPLHHADLRALVFGHHCPSLRARIRSQRFKTNPRRRTSRVQRTRRGCCSLHISVLSFGARSLIGGRYPRQIFGIGVLVQLLVVPTKEGSQLKCQ